MARKNNFLLGQGQRLSAPIKIQRGGSPKNPPYDFPSAVARTSKHLATVTSTLQALPDDACPGDEVVAVVTMHPRYISKSDFPESLLSKVGLRSVGSRSRTIKPERWGVKKPPESAVTDEVYVAGPRAAFATWSDSLERWSASGAASLDLTHVEEISVPAPQQKLRLRSGDVGEIWLEVVLHDGANVRVLDAFDAYVKKCGGQPNMDKRLTVRGVSFVPVLAGTELLDAIAHFSFLRVARGMPTLRPLRPGLIRSAVKSFQVQLPTFQGTPTDHRGVVFDGGMPDSVLSDWVTPIDADGIGNAVPSYLEHGLAVSSALLLGPLSKNETPPAPRFLIDHVRVLDAGSATNSLEYVDVLQRITQHLRRHPKRYAFANISIGPDIPVEDDEITAWTAQLDELFANGDIVATVAAGNDGDRDPAAGLNRVQPPADGVNVLSIGALDATHDGATRAFYSCVGPGRSPGRVKPDGATFGGSDAEPFFVLAPTGRAEPTMGTSFAAPFALRSLAEAAVALEGHNLSGLALRALAIHSADGLGEASTEIGWGRLETNADRLITVEDDEAIVVYQGELPVGEHLRLELPLRNVALQGLVTISATVVIAPDVDPQYPGTYTRSGMEVAFRPNENRKTTNAATGLTSRHAKTNSFFSERNMYSATEFQFREGGHKWEPCLRGRKRLRALSLQGACFDVYYHSRLQGAKNESPPPIPYAFVIGISAARVPNLYDQVVRAYQNVLVPMRPRVRVPVTV